MGTSVSGLASGFDWASMIDQLIAIDHGRIDLIEDQKNEYESKLAEWQKVNTMLLSLDTSVEALKDPVDFDLFSTDLTSDNVDVDAEDLLSVTSDSTASTGSYSVKVTNLAKAQKLSSNSFTSKTSELGSAYAGEITINNKVIAISGSDSLLDLAGSINSANSGTDPIGVTASIVSYGSNDYRLILTSDETGADGISLLNGSSANLVQKFGWKDNQAASIKNSITQGAQSDLFSSSGSAVKSVLGLTTGEASTGTLAIDGTAVTIDLSSDTLTDIKDAINTAMAGAGKGGSIAASVVSETIDGTSQYRLQIEGTTTFTDEKNILNTLGILDHTSASVSGVESGNSMTSDGSYVSSDILLTDIDGYISYTGSDNIQLTGTKTGGGAVNSTFNISSSSTIQDLLDEIETQYSTASGDAVAYLTSDGKIRVDDVAGGGSLDVILTDNITSGQLEFVDSDAAFSAGAARVREIIAGEDATVEIDGVQVTDSSNIIKDTISGITLNLVNEDNSTTITLDIEHDTSTIKSKVQDFINDFNDIASYINTQFSYDEDSETTGGILFGENTLSSIKRDLLSIVTESVWGVDDDFSSLSLIGIETDLDDNKPQLTLDETVFNGYLDTNFNDVRSLFIGQGTVTGGDLSYIAHSNDTEKGSYAVQINRAATKATETGNIDLSSGGAGETLTITEGSKTATVTITSDMTIGDIKNAINTELDAEYAETLVGDELLYSDNTQTNSITATTTWDTIYDSSGVSAGLSNDDVISYTGTSRTGESVAGSYTISDITTDTVQGLLSSIEEAYGSDVTASIDSSGRFVLTDDSLGESQLSISVTGAAQLDLGTVDITNGAGDGSKEGRYSLAVTASDDGSDHLVINSDEYGDTGFTISQDTTDNNYNHIIHTETNNTTITSSGDVYITESTTWDDLYGAGSVNGDTITISGTDRAGNALTPGTASLTYTISDISTGTINDLLTQIESVYSDAGNTTPTTVDAFIQDGKIYVEQTGTTGSSLISLSLTANNEGGGSLNLGTIDQATERDLDLGLINRSVTGQDVAGTIGGEAATGSGQVLKGDEDNVNTEDLSVRYEGTSDNTSAGTVTMTIGIAELLDRVLFNITDSIDGYLSYKQESLQTGITRFDDKIEEMEARLDMKSIQMYNKYTAMELALSRLQTQSQWLTGQLSALPKPKSR